MREFAKKKMGVLLSKISKVGDKGKIIVDRILTQAAQVFSQSE